MTAAAPPSTPGLPVTPDALLRRLEWTVIKRLDGLLQGDYRTLWRGAGIDLADLREYQHHDDVRHIDWNVTARLQQPYVRQFVEDRDLNAWFLLDLSGSVDFGSSDVTKLAISAGFVATVARVLTRHGNRVGALLYGSHVEAVMPPRASRGHVLELLQRMTAPRPRATPATLNKNEPPVGATSLAELLQGADHAMRRRSLVFVVSDFISEPGWEDALARMARRHDVVAVRLWDPLEMALPDGAGMGLLTVEDAETGEQLLIDTADPAFRARYAAIAEQRETELIDALSQSGADVLELATDDDLLDALMRFADLRKQRARLKTPARFPARFKRARTLTAALEPAT
ncbi:MAG: DUF58 domain-containing protein [Pseudomonadota bacterium]|nr:DUF58 domain-containing protein [Pseudomonadota bacterium]